MTTTAAPATASPPTRSSSGSGRRSMRGVASRPAAAPTSPSPPRIARPSTHSIALPWPPAGRTTASQGSARSITRTTTAASSSIPTATRSRPAARNRNDHRHPDQPPRSNDLMSLKIRLARAGAKKRPFYRIVIADSRSPRDGRFIEKIGSYNPMLKHDDPQRVTFNTERMQHWLKVGAQPTDRIAVFLGKAGLAPVPAQRQQTTKHLPKAKAQERAKAVADKAAAAAPAETPAS